MKEKLKDNLILFGKVCFPRMFAVKSPPFHYEIAANLMDKTVTFLNIIAPRGHAKSSLIACVKVLHHIFFDDGTTKFVILVSKTEGHAIRLLQTIKDTLEYSQNLRAIFGYWGVHTMKVNKANEIVLKDGSAILARGTGQMVVGLKHGDQRPTFIVLDDPEDMMNTKTPESMDFNFRWLLQSLIPTRDPLKGRVVVVGTPQHQACMVEKLKRMTSFKTLHYKAIQEDGSALWPEWWSVKRLNEEKQAYESVGKLSSFYREYQCTIIGDEEQLFREEYLQFYTGELLLTQPFKTLKLTSRNGVPVNKLIPVNVFMGIDPASSQASTACDTTIVPIAIDAENNRYVLPYYAGKVTPLEGADRVIEWYKRFKPDITRVESTGYQEMLRQYLRQLAQDQGLFIPGLEIKESPRTSKSSRLEALQPYFAARKMFLQPEGMDKLKGQLLLYPRTELVDLIDGLWYAMKGSYPPPKNIKVNLDDKKEEKKVVGIDWISVL